MTHPIWFVGAGPGDPDLITVKGKQLLMEADRVVYAGSLVPKTLLNDCRPGTRIHDSASLALSETHELLRDGYRAGEKVVRLHTGDPSLYGAIQEQMELLQQEGIPFEVVPGVSAAFAAAAALRQELTLPGVSQTVILTRMAGRTPVPEKEALASLAAHQATLVIYLSVQQMEKVVADLLAHYPSTTPVVVAYRVGWPDQAFVEGTLENIAGRVRDAGIRRQALIMVGDVFKAREHGVPQKSMLYDAAFTHAYRSGRESQ